MIPPPPRHFSKQQEIPDAWLCELTETMCTSGQTCIYCAVDGHTHVSVMHRYVSIFVSCKIFFFSNHNEASFSFFINEASFSFFIIQYFSFFTSTIIITAISSTSNANIVFIIVHPEGPHLEGRRPETSRAADALVVLVCGLSESTSRWTSLLQLPSPASAHKTKAIMAVPIKELSLLSIMIWQLLFGLKPTKIILK